MLSLGLRTRIPVRCITLPRDCTSLLADQMRQSSQLGRRARNSTNRTGRHSRNILRSHAQHLLSPCQPTNRFPMFSDAPSTVHIAPCRFSKKPFAGGHDFNHKATFRYDLAFVVGDQQKALATRLSRNGEQRLDLALARLVAAYRIGHLDKLDNLFYTRSSKKFKE